MRDWDADRVCTVETQFRRGFLSRAVNDSVVFGIKLLPVDRHGIIDKSLDNLRLIMREPKIKIKFHRRFEI